MINRALNYLSSYFQILSEFKQVHVQKQLQAAIPKVPSVLEQFFALLRRLRKSKNGGCRLPSGSKLLSFNLVQAGLLVSDFFAKKFISFQIRFIFVLKNKYLDYRDKFGLKFIWFLFRQSCIQFRMKRIFSFESKADS